MLERSTLTPADILEKGFTPRVVMALEHISRVPEETYEQYIDRVLLDNLATRVKMHDLADKMNLLHVQQLDPADLKRYNKQLTAYHRLRKLMDDAKALAPIPESAAQRKVRNG